MDTEAMTVERFGELESAEKARVLSLDLCPVDVIRAGVKDEAWEVRAVAVGNPSAPEDVIQTGERDKDPWVREAVLHRRLVALGTP